MSSHSSLRPEVQKDIQELRQKIGALQEGQLDEERFKHYRLTRGVYGQRQLGVQMFRIKIPYGRISTDQLDRIGRIARTYTNGNLHLTTRQDIQLHFVKLEDSPAIWTELEELHITAREACGNTVRNVTGSPLAGIDPNEPFDISPYAEATTQFFLRNPICQDMGRKIKIAFSASEADSAFTYFHDFGFIPKIELIDGVPVRGFKVLVGGGLGAQSMVAKTAYEFLAGDEIIPFMEAAIRVFDRHGERQKRFKARMKFLIKSLGLEEFMALVQIERKANKVQRFPILAETAKRPNLPSPKRTSLPNNPTAFQEWKAANTFSQKQEGFVGVKIRLPLGNILTETVYAFTKLVRQYAADDIRLTVNQGILLRYVRPSDLPALFDGLDSIGLGDPGFDSLADITACPGTDTCALGVTNSTALAARLEEVIREEYPGLVADEAMKIKISGCMNACGQHMAAQIGFHGSSIKKKPLVIPAMQIVLGGGVAPDGRGFIAEKIIKLPTKRIPQALRILLDDYEAQGQEHEIYPDYVLRQGKHYFYQILKPLASIEDLSETDFFDWGQDHTYRQSIGVGECAGVAYDVVGAIIADAREKIDLAQEAFLKGLLADSIYHSYSGYIIGAKALLLANDESCNTHIGILNDFQSKLVDTSLFEFAGNFPETVLRINQNEAETSFAKKYGVDARAFVQRVIDYRSADLADADKTIIRDYYKA